MFIKHSASLRFTPTWDVLGPFQTGTREASWGADPLEYLGGFRAINYDEAAMFPSSLPPNGRAKWSRQPIDNYRCGSESAEAELAISFPEVDWTFLQSVYGWAAMQYQAWARGSLTLEADEPHDIILYTDRILEFRVDDRSHFGGDFYSYRRAPLVLNLQPGAHKLDVRIIRDVRLMGGQGEPKTSICLKAEAAKGGLVILREKVLMPEIVDNMLASSYASIPVRNEGSTWLDIWNVESMGEIFTINLLEKTPLRLAPGQSRPIAFRMATWKPLVLSCSFKVTYATRESSTHLFNTVISYTLSRQDLHAPHRITFLHPSNTVSYAILRAPSNKVSEKTAKQHLPILLNLHGAGLEADGHQVRHMLDVLPDLRAWVLFPTGGTPWSGDDWHAWGLADTEAAAKSIEDWIQAVGWEGPAVSVDKWLVSGHSNGGQGTWYIATHRPDNIIGAAPVSGYSSVQGYVPYQMWNESDARVASVLSNALQSFRHELLVGNFKGIPVLQQHGGADDNVPAFHSRRLNQLIHQTGPGWLCDYVELRGKGHWFDGVMATEPLQKFFTDLLAGDAKWPELPQCFTVVVANPADMGTRGGLAVDQLMNSDQLGRIEVAISPSSACWNLRTSNILRFHFSSTGAHNALQSELKINGQSLQLPPTKEKDMRWIVRSEDACWKVSYEKAWLVDQRHASQLGPLDSILRTRGHFLIRTPNQRAFPVASQISRNLYQYFAADSEILDIAADVDEQTGNVITVALGQDAPYMASQSSPIRIDQYAGVVVRRYDGSERIFDFQGGLGVISLAPLAVDRLEMVIWGYDDDGLRQAARLMPLLTGVGQPDFVVVGKTCAWEGAAGALAMGSFDRFWNSSEASFIS